MGAGGHRVSPFETPLGSAILEAPLDEARTHSGLIVHPYPKGAPNVVWTRISKGEEASREANS